MENQKQSKIKLISYIQFLCAILIVILHSNNISGYAFNKNTSYANQAVYYFEEIITVFGHVAVPIFFYITGYLMYRNYSNNFESYLKKVKSRISTLVQPYLLWNFIIVLFYWILSRIPLVANRLNHMYVPNDLSFIIKSILNSDFTPLWYVRNIFILAVLSIMFYQIIRFKFCGMIVIGFLVVLNLLLEFNYFGIIYWLPMYLFGGMYALHGKSIFRLKDDIQGKLLKILFIVFFLFNIFSNNSIVLYIYRFLSPFVVGDFFRILYEKNIFLKTERVWKYSFFTYCSHFILISIYQKIILILFGNGCVVTLISYLSTPIICLSIIFSVAYMLERYCPFVWKLLTGNR